MSRSNSTKRQHVEKSHDTVVMCRSSRKITHRSRKRALTAMNQLLGSYRRGYSGGRDSQPASVYRCPDCRGWHLTSQAQETW